MKQQQRLKFSLGVVALAACMAVGAAHAATMRWAGANDILTVDPHAQNHQTTHAFLQQIYEGLVRYDKNYQVQPALATKWTQVSPTQVRFELRKGVKFHDGAPFTRRRCGLFHHPADDAAVQHAVGGAGGEGGPQGR